MALIQSVLTWEEAGFKQSKEESAHNEACVTLSDALAYRNNTLGMCQSKHRDWPSLGLPQQTIIELSHVEGGTFLIIRLLGTSKRMYGMKNTKSAMLYSFPFIPRSFSRPWIRALPILILSMKASMYRTAMTGTTWRSHFLRSFFSFIRSVGSESKQRS